MSRQLNSGDLFPQYYVQLTDGRALTIPDGLNGEYAILIFYRGVW